ncbi:BadF/BadG/BcrA/BcrD ATPase family protein [Cohnella zeiphila]|uniref:ATPase n=1 Tax=Cohnella zeiphila TaxID=2761120 RepID=A0A7X0SME1_9BACL|nr:BadF/BadG/BcrA/BcrD ATPase family protein [Cohnella zeiphila]MBB6730428.1 ATPase [Cohnella zeiphila]
MKYAAGIDGGGTKTAVRIANEDGRTIASFEAGPLNFTGQDEISVRLTLQDIFDQIGVACGELSLCIQTCIGAAGISHPTVAERLTAAVRGSGYEGGLLLTGDHVTALCGGVDSLHGIIVIAGTGSICYGQTEAGLSHRTGGFGHLIDDEGSGYSIGRELLAAVVRAEDGRSGPTVLTRLAFERLQADGVRDIVGFVYDQTRNKKDIAALAPLLSEACAAGDPAALAIAERSARALLGLVVPVAEKLSLAEGPLALAGSVLLRNDYVRDKFRKLLSERFPRMTVFPARRDAADGAVRLALSRM